MQDSHSAGSTPASRRGFFLGAAAVGAAAAATTAISALPGIDAPAAPANADAAPSAPAKGGGYSLSEHVKRYYRSTSA